MSPGNGHARRPRVLFVEDDPDCQDLVRATLAGDFEVRSVFSMADAASELECGCYDIVLSDLGLPDGSGVGVCAMAAESDPTTTRVILTGSPVVLEQVISGINTGHVHLWLSKDRDMPVLARRLWDAMRHARATSDPRTREACAEIAYHRSLDRARSRRLAWDPRATSMPPAEERK